MSNTLNRIGSKASKGNKHQKHYTAHKLSFGESQFLIRKGFNYLLYLISKSKIKKGTASIGNEVVVVLPMMRSLS